MAVSVVHVFVCCACEMMEKREKQNNKLHIFIIIINACRHHVGCRHLRLHFISHILRSLIWSHVCKCLHFHLNLWINKFSVYHTMVQSNNIQRKAIEFSMLSHQQWREKLHLLPTTITTTTKIVNDRF